MASSLEVPESARKAPCQNTTSIAEAISMNIHRLGTYLFPYSTLFRSEQCPVDGIGFGRLSVEESGVESRGARKRQESAMSEYHFHSRGELHGYPSPGEVPYTAV